MDTYEEFERRQRSFDLLDEHRAALVSEAILFAREHPGVRMFGLILEADAPEAEGFRRAMQMPSDAAGFVGVVPRAMAIAMLGRDPPVELDDAGGAAGPTRRLPILLAAKTGFRMRLAEYDAGDATP